jgi:hypothetical protein
MHDPQTCRDRSCAECKQFWDDWFAALDRHLSKTRPEEK